MKTPGIPRTILAILLICGLAILAMLPKMAGAEGGILITDADSTRTDFPASSSELNNEISVVVPHFQIQFGESLRNSLLANVPPALQTLLEGVDDHIQIQFAQSNRALSTLTYPAEIIDDPLNPQVTDITATPTGDGSTAIISWTTNEFANSTVLFGMQAGSLNQSVSNVLYVKNHSITLTGLTPEAIYYFKVQSSDLEGNMTESAPSSFIATVTRYLYLPVVTK